MPAAQLERILEVVESHDASTDENGPRRVRFAEEGAGGGTGELPEEANGSALPDGTIQEDPNESEKSH